MNTHDRECITLGMSEHPISQHYMIGDHLKAGIGFDANAADAVSRRKEYVSTESRLTGRATAVVSKYASQQSDRMVFEQVRLAKGPKNSRCVPEHVDISWQSLHQPGSGSACSCKSRQGLNVEEAEDSLDGAVRKRVENSKRRGRV